MTFRPTDDEIARMLRARGSREVPPELRDAIETAVHREARRARRVRRSVGRPALLLAAAIALGAVAGAVSLIGSQFQSSPRHAPAVLARDPDAQSLVFADGTAADDPLRRLATEHDRSERRGHVRGCGPGLHRLRGWLHRGRFGIRRFGVHRTKAIVWTSEDGVVWRVASDDREFEGFWPFTVATNEQGIVLGGFYESGVSPRAPAILSSRDGRAWTKVANLSANLVAALPDRFIAAASGEKAMIWSSSDAHERTRWPSSARPRSTGSASCARATEFGWRRSERKPRGSTWGRCGPHLPASSMRWQRLDLEVDPEDRSYEWMRDVAASASDDGLLDSRCEATAAGSTPGHRLTDSRGIRSATRSAMAGSNPSRSPQRLRGSSCRVSSAPTR